LRILLSKVASKLGGCVHIIADNCDDIYPGSFQVVHVDFVRRGLWEGNNVSKKKKRHSKAEIATKLGEAAAFAAEGRTQREIAQTLGISVMTFHRWRKAQPQMPQSRVRVEPEARRIIPIAHLPESQRRGRIAELQLENTRLRRLVTDLLLEKMRIEDDAERHRGGAALKKA
jgi:putative transposase